MSKEPEFKERLCISSVAGENKKYFLVGGDKVQLAGNIGPVMTVMRVLTRRRNINGEYVYRTIGALCYWEDQYCIVHRHKYNIRDLVLVGTSKNER